ncbi:MAG TPA: hypothetical protein DCZ34_01315, partial [Clostridiales bacterium]|nr:hypothetical protein [Clostridiales bacterium]
MRINEKLSYEKISEKYVIMNNDDSLFDNSTIIILNETASYILDCLKNKLDNEQIVKNITKEYSVSYHEACHDLNG